MDLKGTKTEKNLMEAFAGESQARNKYTYFASKAKKDGGVLPIYKVARVIKLHAAKPLKRRGCKIVVITHAQNARIGVKACKYRVFLN